MVVWVNCWINFIKEGARWNVLLRFPSTLIYWAHSYTDVEFLNQTARGKERGMAFGKNWTENAASNNIRKEMYGFSLQVGSGVPREGGGVVWGGSTPPRSSEGPPKSC